MRTDYQKGMTLVELLVAIAIMSLGMITFTVLSVKAWNYRGYTLEQVTSTASASHVLTKMVHEIRAARQADNGAYAIKEVQDNSLTVYIDVDNDGSAERVRYFIDSNEKLKRGVTEFVGGVYSDSDEIIEVLLSYVTNITEGEKFFSYYDNSFPATSTAPMTTPNAYDVRLIRLHLWINIRPIVAPENVNLESIVELRNLNES